MKTKAYPVYNFFLLISILYFCCGNLLFGQEKVNISAGLGFPELLNVGARYQLGQMQIGISLGSLPVKEKDEKIISFSSDLFLHFAGLSKLSSRRPWYIRMSLNHTRKETEYDYQKTLYLSPRIGREINISKKIGIQLDIGAFFSLYNKTETKGTPSYGGGRFLMLMICHLYQLLGQDYFIVFKRI